MRTAEQILTETTGVDRPEEEGKRCETVGALKAMHEHTAQKTKELTDLVEQMKICLQYLNNCGGLGHNKHALIEKNLTAYNEWASKQQQVKP
jgi:hypothetical protein